VYVANFGVYVAQVNQTECELFAYLDTSAPLIANTEFAITYQTSFTFPNLIGASITVAAGTSSTVVSLGQWPCGDSVVSSCIGAIYYGDAVDFAQFAC
jgi:hypothetical protein